MQKPSSPAAVIESNDAKPPDAQSSIIKPLTVHVKKKKNLKRQPTDPKPLLKTMLKRTN